MSRAAEISRLVLLEKFPDTEKCPGVFLFRWEDQWEERWEELS